MEKDLIEAQKDLCELRVIQDCLMKDKPVARDTFECFLWRSEYFKNKSAMNLVKTYISLIKKD